MEFIAHRRSFDQKEQYLTDHLEGVAAICCKLTGKIGVPDAGITLGLSNRIINT